MGRIRPDSDLYRNDTLLIGPKIVPIWLDMGMQNFTNEILITKVSNGDGASTDAIVSDVIDMTGFDAVTFLASLGDITDGCVLQLTPFENTVSSTSDGVSITHAATTAISAVSITDVLLVSDVIRPNKRYVYAELSRDTQSAAVDNILAFQYKARHIPVTQPASVAAVAISHPEN